MTPWFSLLEIVLFSQLALLLNANAGYNVGLANRMCEFALASYCCGNLGHGAEDWTCQSCQQQPQISSVTVFSSGLNQDANGFVAYDPTVPCIVVAFAGTDPLSIENWLDDLDTIAISYPACASQGCKVHQGFYDTYMAVADDVWAAVENYWTIYGASTPLQITGHSLGGALAAHCALDFYDQKGIQPMFVYTFGEPREGNQKFANYYNSRIKNHYRVTHSQDPVPHVPTEDMGFYHMMEEIFYPGNPNSTFVVCSESGEQSSCSDQYFLDLDIADHLDYMGFDFVTDYLLCKL
jgi:hypothetical protein